jgi:hypothetical protein
VYKGEEILLTFTMDPVIPIAGWTVRFTVSRAPDDPHKIIPTRDAVVVGDGSAGQFTVSLDADDTINVRPGTYFYDAWRSDAEAERVLAAGVFKILASARLPEQ